MCCKFIEYTEQNWNYNYKSTKNRHQICLNNKTDLQLYGAYII